MVLKKPYAFLIRHFKLIHLLLCIPLLYLVIRTGAIATFLAQYVSNNYYTTVTDLSATYINYFMYLAVLVVLLLVLAIYFLMRQKEKSTKFYLFLLLYYIVLFLLISFSHSILGSIETNEIEAQAVRMYRDIAFIVYIPQFFFLGYTALRGIGFDLKKFNFDEDVKELEITDIDDEEFELVFGKDTYKYKRNFRRFIREFKYYVLENKITFSILAGIILVVIGTVFYLNVEVFHKTVRQTKKMNHNNLIVTVTDSVLTNRDLGGNIIDKDKYYLALAVKITNKGTISTTLDYENFRLEVGNRFILPTLDRSSYFADMGLTYARDTLIAAGEENVYVLTYEIDKDWLEKRIRLKILESVTLEVGSVTPIYTTVNLNYEKIFTNKEERTVEFGRILELSKTRIGFVQVELNKYDIKKSYEYTYNGNLKNKVVANSRDTLLILDRNFKIDQYSIYYKARKGEGSFVKDFLKLRYQVNGEQKTVNIINKTPKELTDTWVFDVPEEVTYADSIDLLVCLRGSTYVMRIK